MIPRDRRLKRILAEPPEADCDDVWRVLADYGWTLDREKGSHAVFVQEGEYPFIVPRTNGRKVKRIYRKQLIERLNLS